MWKRVLLTSELEIEPSPWRLIGKELRIDEHHNAPLETLRVAIWGMPLLERVSSILLVTSVGSHVLAAPHTILVAAIAS